MFESLKNKHVFGLAKPKKDDEENGNEENDNRDDIDGGSAAENENENKNGAVSEESGSPHAAPQDDISKIVVEIEKLKGRAESFKEMHQAANERFGRISEQLGELRSMILEREKDGKNLESSVTKAIDLVNEVHPETLIEELRKSDSKTEALKAKMDASEALYGGITKELGSLRSQMSVFRGLESVMQLSQEMKTVYTNVQKVQGIIERHSDKVENLFMTLQKKLAEVQKLAEKMDEMEISVGKAIKDTDSISARFSDTANKSELANLEQRINQRIAQMNKLSGDPGKIFENLDAMSKKLNALAPLQNDVASFKADVAGRFSKITEALNSGNEKYRRMDDLERRVNYLTGVLSEFEKAKTDMIEVLSSNKDILLEITHDINSQRKLINKNAEKIEKMQKGRDAKAKVMPGKR